MEPNHPFSVSISHPHLSATFSVRPTTTAHTVSLTATTSHPILQALLQALGPVLINLLPTILAALFGTTPTPSPSPSPST